MKPMLKKVLAASALVLFTNKSLAGPITFNFILEGFSNGGSVSGSFIGEDLNGDGYISSFPFSQDVDFVDNPFSAGLSEVTMATASFTGEFNAGEFGGDLGTTNSFSVTHDLTDITDALFPGGNIDLFFMLNYQLDRSGLLGDDALEGLVLAPFDQSFVLGLGAFLPSPEGQGFTGSIPAGSLSFAINDLLPGGSTLTAGILDNQSGGAQCLNDAACGVVHSVFLDDSFTPNLGGFDITNQFAAVSSVSAPATMPLFCGALAAFIVIRLKRNAPA